MKVLFYVLEDATTEINYFLLANQSMSFRACIYVRKSEF